MAEFSDNDAPEKMVSKFNSLFRSDNKCSDSTLVTSVGVKTPPDSKNSVKNTNAKQTLTRNLTKTSTWRNDRPYILVVDDDYLCRKNIKNLVKSIVSELNLDVGVIKASDGLDILSQVINDQSKNSQIKLIICDENMAYLNGSDSFRLLNTLADRKKLSKVPMVILTALEESDFLNQMLNSGIISELSRKPANKQLIKKIIKKYIE